MHITKAAVAGTLESSDVLVSIEPNESGKLEIDLQGAVASRFAEQIRSLVAKTLDEFDVTSCRVRLQDKGALDCTIKARLSTAIMRASEESKTIEWEAKK